jgi:hypothetical protein
LVALTPALFAAGPEHQAPVENLAAPQAQTDDSAHQSLLAEMWQRRILSNETRSWTAEDLDMLLKVRSAEELGAINLLRRKIDGPLGTLVVSYKPAGARMASLRLTRDGFDRWQFYRSQDAIDYFTFKGVDSGLSFRLEDLDGRKLFDANGRLTAAGDDVYNRALANMPTWWKLPQTGEIWGTRPPSQAKSPSQAKPAEDPSSLPVTVGPEHAAIAQQAYAQAGQSYAPQLRVTDFGRVRVVMEHEPHNGDDAYVVIVTKEKDKPAARRELRRQLPQLGVIPFDKVLTVEEKLKAMDKNLAHVAAHTEGRVKWTVDRAAVEKQLRDLLKGKLAVAWVLTAQPPPVEAAPEPEPAPQPEAPKPDAAKPEEPKPDAGAAAPSEAKP